MDKQLYEEYWKDIMENRRMPVQDEAHRLVYVLLGHLHTHNLYCESTNQEYLKMDGIEFWSSKRPYGNKDIEASIAYSLGWDYQRILTNEGLPEVVREKARELHNQVVVELKEVLAFYN